MILATGPDVLPLASDVVPSSLFFGQAVSETTSANALADNKRFLSMHFMRDSKERLDPTRLR